MDTVRLVLTCPKCGNSTWVRREDGCFECLFCGDVYAPEDMGSEAVPVDCGLEDA